MKKTNLLIVLFLVALSSCSREEKDNIATIQPTGINTYGLVDFSKRDDNVTKQQIIHSYETDIYNHVDKKYKYYIWHTQGDDKVRSSHEELDGTIHSIDEDIFLGEDYNCRCWAEEVSDEEALR